MAAEKYLVGYSGYKVSIEDGWKVLDIGSGHNPFIRADIILDKNIENNKDRAGQSLKTPMGQKFIKGDACCLPFKDKEFDYVIASHIAEHIEEPAKFCRELIRVGKRGYIETPSKLAEMIMGEAFHKWCVYKKKNILVFERKRKPYKFGLLNKIVYFFYYLNQKRENRRTLYFSNEKFRNLSNKTIRFCLKPLKIILKKFGYTSFEWRDKFNYQIKF